MGSGLRMDGKRGELGLGMEGEFGLKQIELKRCIRESTITLNRFFFLFCFCQACSVSSFREHALIDKQVNDVSQ